MIGFPSTAGQVAEAKAFLDTLLVYTRLLAELSGAGVLAIVFTWLRVFHVFGDSGSLPNFSAPKFLIVPLVSFFLALVSAYFITQAIAGYYFETWIGIDQTTQKKIETTDVEYFEKYYRNLLTTWGVVQLISSIVVGIFPLGGWYLWNVVRRNGWA